MRDVPYPSEEQNQQVGPATEILQVVEGSSFESRKDLQTIMENGKARHR